MIASLVCWMRGHAWGNVRPGYYHGCAWFYVVCKRCGKRWWEWDPTAFRGKP